MRSLFLVLCFMLVFAATGFADDAVLLTGNCILNEEDIESEDATGETFTITGHSFSDEDTVYVDEADCGVSLNTAYYICNAATDTFQLDDTDITCASLVDITTCTTTTLSVVKTSTTIVDKYACGRYSGTWSQYIMHTGNWNSDVADKAYRLFGCDMLFQGTVTAASVRVEGNVSGADVFDTDGIATEVADSKDFTDTINSFSISGHTKHKLRANVLTLVGTGARMKVVCTGRE